MTRQLLGRAKAQAGHAPDHLPCEGELDFTVVELLGVVTLAVLSLDGGGFDNADAGEAYAMPRGHFLVHLQPGHLYELLRNCSRALGSEAKAQDLILDQEVSSEQGGRQMQFGL